MDEPSLSDCDDDHEVDVDDDDDDDDDIGLGPCNLGAGCLLGIVLLVLLLVFEVAEAEVTQGAAQQVSVFMLTWWCMAVGVVAFPCYLVWRLIASACGREQEALSVSLGTPVRRLLWTSLLLGLWEFASLFVFFMSLHRTLASNAIALYNLNVLWVFGFSVCLLGERVYTYRLVCIAGALGGVACLTLGHFWNHDVAIHEHHHSWIGDVFGFAAAFMWGAFFVMFKRTYGEASGALVNAFNSLAALYSATLLWPGFLVLNATGWKPFQLPVGSHQWLLVGGAGVFSFCNNYLYTALITLLSPTLVSMVVILGIPLTAIADLILHGDSFPPLKIAGAIVCLLSLAAFSLKPEQLRRVLNMCRRKLRMDKGMGRGDRAALLRHERVGVNVGSRV